MNLSAAKRLKALREKAGLTVRQVAGELQMPATTYANYENRYKKTLLPVELCNRLQPILSRRGIEADEVMALCGFTMARPLAANEQELLELFSGLSAKDRLAALKYMRSLISAAGG